MDKELRTKRRTSTSPDRPDKRIRLSTASVSTSTSCSGPLELASRSAVFESAEIFLHILSFLPVDEIINVERVCRYWRMMAEDGSLWRKMYLGEWHIFDGKDPCRLTFNQRSPTREISLSQFASPPGTYSFALESDEGAKRLASPRNPSSPYTSLDAA